MKPFLLALRPVLASTLLAGLVCLILAGAVHWSSLCTLELWGYDFLVWTRGFPPPPDELVIVDFDDATDEAFGTFPIPRALLAQVIDKIAAGQPALIGLDILLDEPRQPQDDEELLAALARAGNVVLTDSFGTAHLPASEPLSMFRRHALAVGFANLPKDADGSIRRTFLLIRTPDYQGLSFPVALASIYFNQPLEPGRPGIVAPGSVYLGEMEIPLDDSGPYTTLIGFWNPQPAYTVSVKALLAPDFDPLVFQDKVILVGQSSTRGKDFYDTPVYTFRNPEEGPAQMAGTKIHAAALATLLTGRTVGVLNPRWLWALNFVLIWIVLAMVISTRALYSVPAVVVGVVGTYFVAQVLFSTHQVWMKFISTEAGIILALPAGLGYRFLEERRLKAHAEADRRELMGLFERYVSPEVAAEIWDRRGEIVLTGQERTATVLFSDIRDFTALTAGKPSAEVLAWLNNYFTAMSEVIKENGGFLNKFIGDGMLILFGVPLSEGVEDDARRAVETARQMLQRVGQLNAHCPPGWPPLRIGIGIHTGPLTAGNVGARDRLEYSVIGETVNLASRLEVLTKEFKTPIILSPQTRDLVQDKFRTRPLGEAKVRGFSEKIQVYTLEN